jgi:group I intron endonuclease
MKKDAVDPIGGYRTSCKRKEQGVYTMSADDRVYVGSTVDLHRRMIQHRHGARTNHFNENLRRVFNSGGEVILDFIPVEGGLDDIREKEAELIALYASEGKLMNISLDPNCPMSGAKHSKESKAKIAESHRGKFVSEETRRRRSQTLMGHDVSDETRTRISNSRTKYRVVIDGVEYSNAVEASEKLGIGDKGLVRYRCISPNYPNYQRIPSGRF